MLGQTLAALVLIKSGTYIKLTFLPIWVAIPLTILWILAVTNAFNIIDIMDGLASGVAAVAAMSHRHRKFPGGTGFAGLPGIVLAGATSDSCATTSILQDLSGRCRKHVHRIHAGGAFDECRIHARRICSR